MYQANTPHKLLTLTSRHFIALAWLLLAAQLFSQLHGLEHLQDADHDGHSEKACQLCMLSAGLDHGRLDTFVVSGNRPQASWLPNVGFNSFTPKLLTTYLGRAPPSTSSIA
ncbi:MAG: hypothetical protein KDI55_20875 [Anaerolineae bacterium]|nr:hypothetical protein [Anaerolineae bacterium]